MISLTCPKCGAVGRTKYKSGNIITYECGTTQYAAGAIEGEGETIDQTTVCCIREIKLLKIENALLKSIVEYMKQREEGTAK